MKGRLFQPGKDGVTVDVNVAGNDLSLTADEGVSLRWPLDSLEPTLGGDGSGHLVLTPRPTTPGAEPPALYVERAGLVGELDAQGAPPWFVDRVKALIGEHRRRWAASRTVILGVVTALLLGIGVLLLEARALALRAVPPSWEVEAGDAIWDSHKTTLTLVDDPELTRFIEETCRRLLAVRAERPPYPFKFHVARDPAINAFAFPGGNVVVNTGLIAKAGSPDEVAGVLAHELAHVIERHSLESALDKVGLLVVIGVFLDPGSSLAELHAALSLIDLKFSRDHEREADAVGLQMLHQAGFDPLAMGRFFDTLAKETGDLGGALSLISTHPASSERSAELKKKAEALPPVPRVQVVSPEAWEDLKAKAR